MCQIARPDNINENSVHTNEIRTTYVLYKSKTPTTNITSGKTKPAKLYAENSPSISQARLRLMLDVKMASRRQYIRSVR